MRQLCATVGTLFLCACAVPQPEARLASFGPVHSQHVDDLLTAGLGASGLAARRAPDFADPLHPTPAELRRNAIFHNYRAIVDINPLSGYGSLYGPGERAIAGTEWSAYEDDGSGQINISLLVQVPDSFDMRQPCIVVGASSGSSGIYGAIATAGEWGLQHGCAVAHADKGTGTGLYTFDDDSVNLRNGVRAARAVAGREAIFAPAMTEAERSAFALRYRDRLAFKHAHSLQNPEARWGEAVLQALRFAFQVLNEGHADSMQFGPANTLVMAAGVSNGGGAVLRAAELDTAGWIDGVVVSEPQVQVDDASKFVITQGGAPVPAFGKALLDYSTFAALYEPCIAGGGGRCAALVAKGLLAPGNRVADAYARMQAYGWQPDAASLLAAHAATNALIAVTYAYAYGRFPVSEPLCGFTFASVDLLGLPAPLSALRRAQSFANQSGIPGSVVYEASLGGPRAWQLGVSPSTGLADQSLDGFLCLRALAMGKDAVTGGALSGQAREWSERVRTGMAEVRASGKLHGKPAIVVQGRSDALIPPNHGARAYGGLNALHDGRGSRLRYVEVTHGNHFDIFSTVAPAAIVPLNLYFHRALDAMYAHLKDGSALPASQLVRTTPRFVPFVPLGRVNVPPIGIEAGEGDAIVVRPGRVEVPD